jgi:hypothetical protein
MRFTLGTPSQAGCGIGGLLGVVAAAAVIYLTPRDNFRELGILMIPGYLAWFTLVGAFCGNAGALIRRAPLAAICGAAIALMPLMIGRLCAGSQTIWPVTRAEVMSLAFGTLTGLAGSLISDRANAKRPKS